MIKPKSKNCKKLQFFGKNKYLTITLSHVLGMFWKLLYWIQRPKINKTYLLVSYPLPRFLSKNDQKKVNAQTDFGEKIQDPKKFTGSASLRGPKTLTTTIWRLEFFLVSTRGSSVLCWYVHDQGLLFSVIICCMWAHFFLLFVWWSFNNVFWRSYVSYACMYVHVCIAGMCVIFVSVCAVVCCCDISHTSHIFMWVSYLYLCVLLCVVVIYLIYIFMWDTCVGVVIYMCMCIPLGQIFIPGRCVLRWDVWVMFVVFVCVDMSILCVFVLYCVSCACVVCRDIYILYYSMYVCVCMCVYVWVRTRIDKWVTRYIAQFGFIFVLLYFYFIFPLFFLIFFLLFYFI